MVTQLDEFVDALKGILRELGFRRIVLKRRLVS